MINFLKFLTVWVIVPIILISLFFHGVFLMLRIENVNIKTSANAAFKAGLILFIIYVFYSFQYIGSYSKTFNYYDIRLNLIYLFMGIGIGFLLLFLINKIKSTSVISFIILILTFSSTSALFSYLFIQIFNNILISFTLGLAFGTFLYIIINPNSINTLF